MGEGLKRAIKAARATQLKPHTNMSEQPKGSLQIKRGVIHGVAAIGRNALEVEFILVAGNTDDLEFLWSKLMPMPLDRDKVEAIKMMRGVLTVKGNVTNPC